MQRDGRPLRYVLFKPKGIVGPVQVLQRANRSPLGYVSSAPLRELNWTDPTAQEQVQQFLQRQDADLITSCEFWRRKLPVRKGHEFSAAVDAAGAHRATSELRGATTAGMAEFSLVAMGRLREGCLIRGLDQTDTALTD